MLRGGEREAVMLDRGMFDIGRERRRAGLFCEVDVRGCDSVRGGDDADLVWDGCRWRFDDCEVRVGVLDS